MMGGLSFLAVGFVIGVAIAWGLPAARAAEQTEKPAGEPDSGAGPKNDQPSPVKLDADDTARVWNDRAGDDDPMGYGAALDQSQCDAGRLDGAHVAVKLSSIVAEPRKNIGEPRGCDSPVGEHPFARFFQNSFWGGIARISWIDFFESKWFGASFGGATRGGQ